MTSTPHFHQILETETKQGHSETNRSYEANGSDRYSNLWGTIKAVLRGKLIALSASKKKLERPYISSLTAHLKALGQKEGNTPKWS